MVQKFTQNCPHGLWTFVKTRKSFVIGLPQVMEKSTRNTTRRIHERFCAKFALNPRKFLTKNPKICGFEQKNTKLLPNLTKEVFKSVIFCLFFGPFSVLFWFIFSPILVHFQILFGSFSSIFVSVLVHFQFSFCQLFRSVWVQISVLFWSIFSSVSAHFSPFLVHFQSFFGPFLVHFGSFLVHFWFIFHSFFVFWFFLGPFSIQFWSNFSSVLVHFPKFFVFFWVFFKPSLNYDARKFPTRKIPKFVVLGKK